MKKGKLTMTISIGITSVILTMVLFMQFKTVEQTNITEIENMRETELRTELTLWKSKYDEVAIKLDEVTAKVNEYNEQLKENKDTTELVNKDIVEAEMYLGYTDVEGEGLVITLEDNSKKGIGYEDLLSLVNELKYAGAEAISINDERIVNTSDIVVINDYLISVNGGRIISSPYVVRVIGNPKDLEVAISAKYGYIDTLKGNGKSIDYNVVKSVRVNKYNGEMQMKNAEENEE